LGLLVVSTFDPGTMQILTTVTLKKVEILSLIQTSKESYQLFVCIIVEIKE